MAAIMDPRFKLAWCQDEEAASLKYTLQNEEASLTPLQTVEQSLSSQAEPPKERSQFFSFMKDNALARCSKKGSITDEEIAKYLSESCVSENADPLHYWEVHSPSMPILAQLAAKCLVIPATSAPIERLFSVAGQVFKRDRCLLSDKRFQILMFIKFNKHFKC